MKHIHPALLFGILSVAGSASLWGQSAVDETPTPKPHPAHTSTTTAEESVPKTAAEAKTTNVSSRPMGNDPDPAAAKAAADFVLRAGIDGMTEVQLGHLALSRSHNPQVRELAEHIVSDHDEANGKLSAVAQMKNISMPKQLDAAHEAVVRQLSAKQGPAFDSAYLSQTIAAHTRAISLFTAASGQLDSEIAAFAYRTLPTLKAHKQSAESVKLAKVGDGESSKGS